MVMIISRPHISTKMRMEWKIGSCPKVMMSQVTCWTYWLSLNHISKNNLFRNGRPWVGVNLNMDTVNSKINCDFIYS